MSESKPLHVILGAGQIAMLLADRLLGAGFRVRLVRRGRPAGTRENLSWAYGDLRDRGFAEEATRGAAVSLSMLAEMTYLYKGPFVVDDRRFRAAFGRRATSTDVAIDVTARWARERFSPAVQPTSSSRA